MSSERSTRIAEPGERRPITLPLSTPRVPSDLFRFLPGSAWDVRSSEYCGVRLEREALYRGGVRCSLVVDTFRDSYANEPAGVAVKRSYLSCITEAGYAEIVLSEPGLAHALDEIASEAVEENQEWLEEEWGDR